MGGQRAPPWGYSLAAEAGAALGVPHSPLLPATAAAEEVTLLAAADLPLAEWVLGGLGR